MAEPERRRRRPAVSCTVCRKRKIRCNRELPCSNCLKSRCETCIYENFSSQPARQQVRQGQSSQASLAQLEALEPRVDSSGLVSADSALTTNSPTSLVVVSTPGTVASAREIELLKNRILQLETQLVKRTPRSAQSRSAHFPGSVSASNVETTATTLAGNFHVHHDNLSGDRDVFISRSVMHKTRLFGQSHWINGVIQLQDIFEIIEPRLQDDGESKINISLKRCKYLGKVIKCHRAPKWPTPPTPDLPPRDVADKLVDGYLRTSETVYRILHIPTFMRDYEALWVPNAPEPNKAFLVQLKLVFAIGFAVHDEEFSLRASAIRWVYEAQTWISEPEFKARLTIQTLQTHLLLLLAREATGIGGSLIWISAGHVFRSAVYMGLHRDPAYLNRRTAFADEMHRRLWNTILEILVQSSIHSGGPPQISLDEFDTEPPGNFDDDQLSESLPVPKQEDEFTPTSIARALRKTFPLRLAIAKFLNNLGSSGTYEETLRLDAELRSSYKELYRTLQGFKSKSSTGSSPTKTELSVVDLLVRRYIVALHTPFFGPSLHETTYAFTRKVMVDTAIKMWCALYPFSSIMSTQPGSSFSSGREQDDLARLALCSAGFFRMLAFQAGFVIGMELKRQLQEEDSLGPVPLRSDLLSIMADVKKWCMRCIQAGELNVKGYLMQCLMMSHIDSLMRGLGKDEIADTLIKAGEDCVAECVPVLEEMATRCQSAEDAVDDGLQSMSLNTPPELMALEGWDFMVDGQFNFGNAEPMNWTLSDEDMQVPPLW